MKKPQDIRTELCQHGNCADIGKIKELNGSQSLLVCCFQVCSRATQNLNACGQSPPTHPM
eukprot:m.157800 g.157800  ORF g.157800 m.157800 type:complete len:60 (-) comp16456_c0_seq18:670-849(-)